MNKHLYRIIFNAKRSQRMAVAEAAKGQGKGTSGQKAQALRKSVAAAVVTAALATCSLAVIALFTAADA